MAFRTPARIMMVGMLTGACTFTSVVTPVPAQAWDTEVWDRVAVCESGANWSINTGNGFYGGLQFLASTWAGFGGTEYAARADLATKDEQIAIARRVLYTQGPGAWPVCSVKAGLTETNGGADPDAMPVSAATALTVDRVWGQTAVGTAAALSEDAFPSGASTAYVATVSGYWDALSGGAAAAEQGGPMLLTEMSSLPQETRDELIRLRPSTIVIQGGVLAISSEVETALKAYAPTVVRNAGDTAIGTAVLTSQRAFPTGAPSVFVATSASFHDALSGGAAAGRNGSPVLLVDPTETVDSRVIDEADRLGVDTIFILGGPLALPDEIEAQLDATGVPVQRLWGQTELDTSFQPRSADAHS